MVWRFEHWVCWIDILLRGLCASIIPALVRVLSCLQRCFRVLMFSIPCMVVACFRPRGWNGTFNGKKLCAKFMVFQMLQELSGRTHSYPRTSFCSMTILFPYKFWRWERAKKKGAELQCAFPDWSLPAGELFLIRKWLFLTFSGAFPEFAVAVDTRHRP